MSYVGMVLVAAMWLTIIISLFVSVGHKLAWLDFLYILSYVKLAVTLIKYVPQVSRYAHGVYIMYVLYKGWSLPYASY